MSRGMTCIQPTHTSQEALAQDVIGLRHSGHCSAAITMLPPCLAWPSVVPPPPPPPSPPQAAALRPPHQGARRCPVVRCTRPLRTRSPYLDSAACEAGL